MGRISKRCLRKIVRRARLTYEELETVLVEIECVINSRPLTYVYSDEVCEGPLITPSHLVMRRRLLSQAPVVRDETDTPAGNGLSRRATYLKKLLEHFWKRWSREYLLELREHHRVKGVGRSAKANPKEGDIVCVYEEKTPRNLWRLGKVEKLFKGNDGQVRAVALRIWNKGNETITLQRPVQKVYPVEESRIEETTSVPVRRSERVAAIEARKQQSKRGR